LAEGSDRRRRSAKNRTQERRTDQTVSKIISQASEDKPHHREKVMRSLQAFTRSMMGLATSAKPEDLPDSVSAEELASWDTWRQRRRAAFTERLKQAEASHPNANEQEIQLIRKNETEILKKRLCGVPFQSSIFLPGSPVSMHLKREMESDLAKHGLHRLTFDWNSSPSQGCL